MSFMLQSFSTIVYSAGSAACILCMAMMCGLLMEITNQLRELVSIAYSLAEIRRKINGIDAHLASLIRTLKDHDTDTSKQKNE